MTRILETRGFRQTGRNSDGDLEFEGGLFFSPASLQAVLAADTLVLLRAAFGLRAAAAFNVSAPLGALRNNLRDSLTSTLGVIPEPIGDQLWWTVERNGSYSVILRRDDDSVVLVIESPLWDAERLRRIARSEQQARAAAVARARRAQRAAEEEHQRQLRDLAEQDEARAARIRAHGWPKDITEALILHRVLLGMTKEMVETGHGPPDSRTRTVNEAGETERWTYRQRGLIVLFKDGRVAEVTTVR